MSQVYHIALRESVVRVVRSCDSVSYPISLTQLLPEEDMKALLRATLEADGWEPLKDKPNVLIQIHGEEQWTLDLDTMELTATLESESEVSANVNVTGSAESERTAQEVAKRRLREKAEAVGQSIEESGRRELQERVTAELAKGEEDRMRAMNEVLQRVYAEALKRKAGQLGEVLEVQEGTNQDGNYELVIRVAQ